LGFLQATKVLEEVAKSDILNLDALAEREEEDEKYEDLIKGMGAQDIESLLTLQAQASKTHNLHHAQQTLAPSSSSGYQSFAADETIEANESENDEFASQNGDVETTSVPEAERRDQEDEWDEFDYPSAKKVGACKSREPGFTTTPERPVDSVRDSYSTTATHSIHDDSFDRGHMDSAADSSFEADGTWEETDQLEHVAASSLFKAGDYLPEPVEGARSQHVVDSLECHRGLSRHNDVQPGIRNDDTKRAISHDETPTVPSKHGKTAKKSKKNSDRSQSRTKDAADDGVLHIAARGAPDAGNAMIHDEHSVTDATSVLNEHILTHNPSLAPIPADVLARILKKREQKLKKKGLWTGGNDGTASDNAASHNASGTGENVTMTMLLSDSFGFGFDDAAADNGTLHERDSGSTLLSTLFSHGVTSNTSRSDSARSSDAGDRNNDTMTDSTASQGHMLGGFVFPISFSANSNSVSSVTNSTQQFFNTAYRSIFDDIVDPAEGSSFRDSDRDEEIYNDPILRQVEANKRLQLTQSKGSSSIIPPPARLVSMSNNNSNSPVSRNANEEAGRVASLSFFSNYAASMVAGVQHSVQGMHTTLLSAVPIGRGEVLPSHAQHVSAQVSSTSDATAAALQPGWLTGVTRCCSNVQAVIGICWTAASCLIVALLSVLKLLLGTCVDVNTVLNCGILTRCRTNFSTEV
jgi:hypothetical protein